MASFLNLVLVMYIIKVYNIERERKKESWLAGQEKTVANVYLLWTEKFVLGETQGMFSLSLDFAHTNVKQDGTRDRLSFFSSFLILEKRQIGLAQPNIVHVHTHPPTGSHRLVGLAVYYGLMFVCVARGANGTWLLQNKSKHKTIGQQEQKHRLSLSLFFFLLFLFVGWGRS